MMNPAWIAKAATQKGISELWKHFNNPDRAIEKMFKEAYKERKGSGLTLHTPLEKAKINKEMNPEKLTGRWRMKYPKKAGLLDYKK